MEDINEKFRRVMERCGKYTANLWSAEDIMGLREDLTRLDRPSGPPASQSRIPEASPADAAASQ